MSLRCVQAGGGEKKRQKEAAETRTLYTNITIALYIVYFTVRVLWQFSSFTSSSIIGLVFLSAVNYFCLTSIFKALEYGTPYSAYQDVLFVNWAVMALSMLTSYAWVVWCIIPAYVLYMYGAPSSAGYAWHWEGWEEGGGGAPQSEVDSEAEKKRLAKKERQADRAQKLAGGRDRRHHREGCYIQRSGQQRWMVSVCSALFPAV